MPICEVLSAIRTRREMEHARPRELGPALNGVAAHRLEFTLGDQGVGVDALDSLKRIVGVGRTQDDNECTLNECNFVTGGRCEFIPLVGKQCGGILSDNVCDMNGDCVEP